MPQNLVDTPPDWQDEIVVPAPGEPAAVANDPGKPHSLFHALAALAKRTRWLRGSLETHRHTWANVIPGAPSPPNGVSVEFTAPSSGLYLLEGRAAWGCWGEVHWGRQFKVDGAVVWDETRIAQTGTNGGNLVGSWADQRIVQLGAGTHVVAYVIYTSVVQGGVSFVVNSMIKVTRL